MTASALSTLFLARFREKSVKDLLGVEAGVKGAFFAFISTLDTGLHTSTIGMGTKIRVLF